MTKLRTFFITIIFITERNSKNAQFYVLATRVDPEWLFQFQKQVIIKQPVKNDRVTALLYNFHFYYRKEAQKYPVFCFGCVSGSRMVFPIPKQVIINIPVKIDQVMTLFCNCRFYHWKKDLLEESPKSCRSTEKTSRNP